MSCVPAAAVFVFVGFASSTARVESYVFDEHAPERSTVTATVATASLGTGEPIVDDELKGSDFFNVAVDPVMTFKSRSVRSTGTDMAEMTGDITVNGITKPITFTVSLHPHDDPPLKYSAGAREFVATGRHSAQRLQHDGLSGMVGDDVDIEIDASVRKKL
jgi:polyisoprenoid-binding protein YceI